MTNFMIINDNLQWINFYKDVHYQNPTQEMLKNLRKLSMIYYILKLSKKERPRVRWFHW